MKFWYRPLKIQLIIPPSGYIAQRWKEGSSMPALGILYVAAVLEKNGHQVTVTAADARKLRIGDILKEVAATKADIVGITITTENRFETFDLARQIKIGFPDKLLVIGGPHATMAGSDMISHIPEIDIAVIGEGEETMLELVRWREAGADAAELKKIKGIIFRLEGRPYFSGPRPPIPDLDPLPFPAKHLVPMERYDFRWPVNGRQLPVANLMSARGCPFNCNFCATPITWGRRVRGYSPQRVLAEIRWNRERFGAEYIWFFDDTFNYNPQRTEELCDLLIREKVGISFTAEVRPDALNYELLARMREAGAHYISFGIEAGSERVRQEIIHKYIPSERIFQLLDWTQKLGITTTAFFIFSHPTETWLEAQETLAIMERIRQRSDISVSVLHIYPGTELETIARQQGLLPEDFSWSRRDHRVATLPAAQGDVPLFIDRFSWWQIGELIVKWSVGSRKTSLFRKIPDLLKSIRSLKDLSHYVIFGLVYLRIKLFGR